MERYYSRLSALKIIPVVSLENADDAGKVADALVSGGLPCAEITFRTTAAADSIKNIAKRGDFLVGAGTVLTVSQVKQAVDNGAEFIVSPGFNKVVVEYCLDNRIPVLPGVCTPTEVMMAFDHGLKAVKFFPAESFGGLKTVKALSAPFSSMRFVPTGGIDSGNIVEYLKFKKVIACGGSWMVKPELIEARDFERIYEITQEAVKSVREGLAQTN